MNPLMQAIDAWIETARQKLERGALSAEDLDLLQATVRTLAAKTQQRLLYLYPSEPSVEAHLLAWREYPGIMENVTRPEPPYRNVLAALADGWQVVHFPDIAAPIDDRETDMIGFEFILHKLEVVEHGD
jgi:hypothetical protein